MTAASHHVIRGGVEGRERLRVLSRVMHSSTASMFDRLHLRSGLSCLDVGCGGGDATLELARRVAPAGFVVGVDIDQSKLDIARLEAQELGVHNVEFRLTDIRLVPGTPTFDVVYARFLLTHLSHPADALAAFLRHLKPGGTVAVEDIDFSGYYTYPESPAFQRYHEWFCAVVQKRGGDPNIGLRLPALVRQAGFLDSVVHIVQPMSAQGEAKLINPITMQNIAHAVLEDGLAAQAEIDEVVQQLYDFAADPNTLAGMPRVVQVTARKSL